MLIKFDSENPPSLTDDAIFAVFCRKIEPSSEIVDFSIKIVPLLIAWFLLKHINFWKYQWVLKYFLNGKNVEIHFKITGKVILFSLPYDIQIESLKPWQREF